MCSERRGEGSGGEGRGVREDRLGEVTEWERGEVAKASQVASGRWSE